MKPTVLPEKLYFKIGEVAELAGVEPYVLRYWESEFKEISPFKSRSRQRLYRKKDIETVFSIKKLLYDEGFTIEGAKKRMKEMKSEGTAEKNIPQLGFGFETNVKEKMLLKEVKDELRSLLQLLNHGT